jgi:hypothetical protein
MVESIHRKALVTSLYQFPCLLWGLRGNGKDDLIDLLTINGDLLGASLTITPPLGEAQEEFLMLQTKFVASEFSEDMFTKSITSLMTQMSIFFEAE